MNKKDHKIVKKQTTIEKPKGRKFLTPKVIWGYATGQLGWAIIAGVMASLITKVWLGWDAKPNDISTAWGGYVYAAHAFIFAVVFGVTKLADAFAAPIIGRWSDKVNTKWGRRIPFLVVALAPMGIAAIFAFFAISNPSHEQSIINLVLLVCLFIIFYISLNMYVIPYTALINDLAKSSEDRVKLTTATAIMYLLGTVLAFGTTMLWGMMHKILGGNYQIAIIVSVAIVV
ncbi:MAG: MFS transporter, partial [Mycoplasmataceae bacterium]|nr:MFS transporter [Mycoplasmataceae bacterium]